MVPIQQKDKQYVFVLLLQLYSYVSFCFTFHISFHPFLQNLYRLHSLLPISFGKALSNIWQFSFPYFSLKFQSYDISLFEELHASYLPAEWMPMFFNSCKNILSVFHGTEIIEFFQCLQCRFNVGSNQSKFTSIFFLFKFEKVRNEDFFHLIASCNCSFFVNTQKQSSYQQST